MMYWTDPIEHQQAVDTAYRFNVRNKFCSWVAPSNACHLNHLSWNDIGFSCQILVLTCQVADLSTRSQWIL